MTVVSIKSTAPDDLDEVDRPIAAGLDMDDRFMRKAFEKFRDRRREVLAEPVDEELILGAITSDEVRNAIIAAWIADVRHTAAKMVVEVRDAALEAAAARVKLAILEHEDVDPDNAPVPDLHRFLLKKPSNKKEEDGDSEEQIEEYCKLLGFMGALAKGVAPEVLEGLKEGQVPDQFANGDGTKAFLSDIAEFLADAGKGGFEILTEVLEDADLALKVLKDNDAPKPLRFVAQMRISCVPRRRPTDVQLDACSCS